MLPSILSPCNQSNCATYTVNNIRLIIIYLFILTTNIMSLFNTTVQISAPGRCGGFMVRALISRLSGPGSSPGQGHCVVLLGKTLTCNSHSASIHPWPRILVNLMLGVILPWTTMRHPI